MAGMPEDDAPLPIDVIARQQGFPLAGAAPPATYPGNVPVPRSALAPGPVAAMKAGPSAGTTEIIPGAHDWIRQLIVDMIPTRNANAAAPLGMPAPDATGLARVRGTPVAQPPQESFFSRFTRGLIGPEDVPPPGQGGVRG